MRFVDDQQVEPGRRDLFRAIRIPQQESEVGQDQLFVGERIAPGAFGVDRFHAFVVEDRARQVAAQVGLPTNTSPFQMRASARSATRPIVLIAVMPRKACWPNLE